MPDGIFAAAQFFDRLDRRQRHARPHGAARILFIGFWLARDGWPGATCAAHAPRGPDAGAAGVADSCATASTIFHGGITPASSASRPHRFSAVLGAAGFAIALALQGDAEQHRFGSDADLDGSEPFSVGDAIDAEITGNVLEVGLFATELRTTMMGCSSSVSQPRGCRTPRS